ncbi:Transcription termination factor 1 [Araneus ventricosus]|uniref:Transcription termination factor 1 n=1 Tax=Araneus ventricosus TaxID=182803 RepID=A0A4Y2CEI3_ARAVE|nr:Transcription termination factor 1 [Araneus ventricosus]
MDRSGKMTDCETYNGFNKQRRKKHKHKSAEAENMLETIIMESNKASNGIVHHESMENKKHTKREKENARKKKVTDCEIIESATVEKSDNNVNSNKFHKKKRTHKMINDEYVSNCRILEMDIQDLENNTSIEIPKELYQHSKKHKHNSLGEMENVSNYRIKESSKAENIQILDNLHKRKRHYKQTEFDNMSDCLNTDLNGVELSQNNFNSEIFSCVHEHKRKKRQKLVTAENLQKTVNMKSNPISNNTVYHEGVEEGIVENSDSRSISMLSRKNNRHSETKAEIHQKKKYKNMNDTNESDGKIVEPTATEKSENDVNSNKFHKKKRKHKVADGENVSECRIAEIVMQESENDTNIKFLKGLRKQKRKKVKHKLLGEMENVFNRQESATDESGKNRILDVENVAKFNEKKKKKHKHKLLDEMENISDCKTVDSNPIEINQNDLNRENVAKFNEKKKKKHKHKLLDEMENISDCKTVDSNTIEINQNELNSENVNTFHEKKKKKRKHKLLDEMENISDCKTVDSNTIEINQNELNSENVNTFHEKKKKKRKHKLLDEIENISDCKTVDSNPIEINQNDLNKFHKKKKKKYGHKLFSEMENTYNDNIQESAIDEVEKNRILDTLHVQKRNKCKSSDVHNLSDHKTIDSTAIEINQNDLRDETFNRLHKAKRKKHRHNLVEVENMPKTVTESNNTLNNVIYREHTKEDREKSIMENSVADLPHRTNGKNKKHVESRIGMLSDNLQEKEKNVSCQGPEKDYQEDVYMSFDPFINDVTDVPVSFPVPLLHVGETVSSITPERRSYLEKNGVTIHTGKWTKIEDDILIRNFQQFGLEFGVDNPFQLLGINQNKKDDKLDKFKRAKHFLIRLGKDLNNRSLRSIYMRARKLLTPLKNKEKLSAEEAADLKHAHELVGNKWTRISDMLSRSDNTCHTAFRWHKSDINKGKWTSEEESNLIKAIKTVSGAEDISANNVKNISWKAIAKYVPTRNEFQCHKQWAEHLAWDSSVTEKKRWEKYHYGKLIYLLKEKYCFNSEHEIDWRELHKHFKDVAPSYIFLHKKWFYLKGRLPKGLDLSYSKCLDAFKSKYEKEYKIFADEKL